MSVFRGKALATLLAVAIFALAEPRAHASEPSRAARDAYVASLQKIARDRHLASQTIWRRLLHYRHDTFGGYTSEADGKPFFLAPDGKGDPEAELAATISGFFEPGEPADQRLQHARCRFPARFRWLDELLHFDRALLPDKKCERYQEFVELLDAKSITLIFSSYYLNNPASAFGHTFLRINRATRKKGGGALLDYGVDYSASVDTNNALLYAFKGLTGMFHGDFRKVPYYLKVREYNDYESRDLWEFALDLPQAEVQRVVDHLWELGSTYFSYYYLSENCSYHVLGVLEVADPKLELLSHVKWPVIPADTVKALFKNPHLVGSVNFRPSNRSQLRGRLGALSPEQTDAVKNLLSDPDYVLPSSFSENDQVRVLDTALDAIDLQLARDLVKDRPTADNESGRVQQRLLERRAALGVTSEAASFPPPLDKMPQTGHGSLRLGLGEGRARRTGDYFALNFRLALHDLADPTRGYPDSAEISFMAGRLRYELERKRLVFDDFSLVRVQSLTPLSRFEHSMSWHIDVGVTRAYDAGCHGCAAGKGVVGAGYAVEPVPALLLYGLLDARLYGKMPGGLFHFLRAEIGPSAGLRLRSDTFALLVTGQLGVLPAQTPKVSFETDAALRYEYVPDFALGIEGRLYRDEALAQGMSYLYF